MLSFTWSCFTCRYAFFFFNDTATTEIYTLSLHDALPILRLPPRVAPQHVQIVPITRDDPTQVIGTIWTRSEEHTSELQSLAYLVCRLLLEKKKKTSLSIYLKHKMYDQQRPP